MIRSPMARSTKPMARSPLPAGGGTLVRSPMRAGTTPLTRTPMARGTSVMKTSRPRMTPIRKSARQEDCTLRFTVCNGDSATTVWCHSNRLADGKGMGIKANDEAGCYGCAACHAYLDGGWTNDPLATFQRVQERFEQARAESRIKLENKGLLPA
jgi:hypothetical protein